MFISVVSVCQSIFRFLQYLFQKLFIIIVPVIVEEDGGGEGFHRTAVFLGGTAGAAGTVDETADAAHLQQFVLLGIGDVFIDFRQEFGTYTLFDALEDFKRIGDGWFLDVYDFANLDRTGGFDADTVHGDTSVLAGISSDAACFEDAGCPQPFVNPCFHLSLTY